MPIQLDDFEVLRKLGSGGLADVFAATSDRFDHEVALKVLRDPDRSRAHRRRFLREGLLLQRLKCPHLPACYEVVDGQRPYIVLEVLDGCTLSQRIRKHGVVDPAAVETIARVVLDALAWLHAHGVVHRDVKAGNVFLCKDDRILVLDLGLAVDPSDPLTTTLGDVMGTYAYMAPEQIAGGETDHRADLYSLGVTLYESLAGRRPYKAKGATGWPGGADCRACPPGDPASAGGTGHPVDGPGPDGSSLQCGRGNGRLDRPRRTSPGTQSTTARGAIQCDGRHRGGSGCRRVGPAGRRAGNGRGPNRASGLGDGQGPGGGRPGPAL